MRYRRSLLMTACLFFSAILSAQQYAFVHYTPKDGLVNSRVRKAYQDSKGRMYFITYGGLSVYDGARFKNYTIQNGLSADLVNDVLEVGDDSLLVATNTCGINVLVHGQMKQLGLAKGICAIANHFLKSNDGNVYATTDDGLYKLGDGKFTKLSVEIPGQHIAATFLGPITEYKDLLIFATYNSNRNYGLFLYNKRTNAVESFLPDMYVYCLETDPAGSLWISTNKTTQFIDTLALAKGKLAFIPARQGSTTMEAIPGGIIHFNSQHELLLSSASNEIMHYRKDGTVQHIASPEFSTAPVQNFFIDREDVVWVCHDGNGVYKLPGTKFQYISSPFSNNRSGIRAITGITADDWWMVMNNGELILQQPPGNKTFTTTPSVNASFIHHGKNYLYAADDHNLYIASPPTENGTVLRLKKIMTVPDTSSFGGLSVTDKDGNVILFESQAICVLQDDKIIFTYPLLPYDLVEGMYMDDHSRLWVIYRYSGLTIFSLHPGSPAGYLKKEFSFTSEFEDSSPRSMVVDGNGILWVGTRYKGLMGFTFESDQLKKIYQFQTHNGLTDNFITSLACDKNNNIIIGTQTGLDRLIKTKEGYRPENITKSNNLFSYINNVWTDGNDNAFAWTKTGEILRMEPVMPANNRTVPELLVEEIKINGKQVTGLGSHFRLNYEQRNITFSVAAPSFIDEKQIKYSYLLSGDGSKEWSDTTSLADINLLNLSPGNYTLHVKAFFSSTNYASKETEFSFSILPPWWKTWWFRIAAALMVIALLIIVTRSYYRQKLEKQRSLSERQQAIEKERTRIATDMHDDLGAGLSTIRFLSEKVKRNSFSDVTKDDADKIVGNADDLVQKMNEIIWAMNEKNDTLEDLIFYTRNYAVEYAEENNLDCHVTLPENIPVVFVNGEVRRNVFLTVKESLHNVVKHAAAKKVNIRISTGKNLEVAIEDNGIGFEENEQSDGNGLKNMKKRIESINGSFDILHTTGTTVLMKVPL